MDRENLGKRELSKFFLLEKKSIIDFSNQNRSIEGVRIEGSD